SEHETARPYVERSRPLPVPTLDSMKSIHDGSPVSFLDMTTSDATGSILSDRNEQSDPFKLGGDPNGRGCDSSGRVSLCTVIAERDDSARKISATTRMRGVRSRSMSGEVSQRVLSSGNFEDHL